MRNFIFIPLFFLCSCMSHTALIKCSGDIHNCCDDQLGKKIHIQRITKIDTNFYSVDYYE